MKLSDQLLRGIYAYGYEKPSLVQQRAILPMKNKHDMLVQAQSGTGKTVSYAIGLLSRIDVNNNSCQVLVFEPTRELSIGVWNVIKNVSKYINGLNVIASVGGTSIRKDIKRLESGNIHCIVTTPGRGNDLIERGYLKLSKLKVFVLDELDEMLNRGFKEQINQTLQKMPEMIQICVFTATMPSELTELEKQYLVNPLEIVVSKRRQLTLKEVTQYYINVEIEQNKFNVLLGILKQTNLYGKYHQIIVFCNTRRKVNWLFTELENSELFIPSKKSSHQMELVSLHGETDEIERNKILSQFNSSTKVLITTDLISNYINNPQFVINFDIPNSDELYLNRIGISKRSKCKGLCINLITNYQTKNLQQFEKTFKTKINKYPKNIFTNEQT